MGYIGNQSAGITYTNINTFRGKVANLTALNAVSGMENGDLYLTEDNNHAHMYTGTVWVDLGAITGPQGPVGPRGIAGASVSTVVRTTGDGSAGTTDVYTITYNDATTSTFTVYNGKNGLPGTINHIKRTVGTGAAGTTDTYTAYADAAETQILGTFAVYNGYDGVASTVGSLVDVDLTTLPVEDGQTIVWNEVEGKWLPGDVSSSAVKLTGDQTVAGVKTFSSAISGSITGNSGTATKLQTAITINGVAFDGSADITVSDATAVKLTGNETIAGIKTFSSSPIIPTPTADTQAANKAYVDSASGALVANDARAKTALNASGEAPIYACRAWVNFNGTGTVAIRASGNVSSITDNGVGDYTVNFTTAMPDANYSYAGVVGGIDSGALTTAPYDQSQIRTNNSFKILTINTLGAFTDGLYTQIVVFR